MGRPCACPAPPNTFDRRTHLALCLGYLAGFATSLALCVSSLRSKGDSSIQSLLFKENYPILPRRFVQTRKIRKPNLHLVVSACERVRENSFKQLQLSRNPKAITRKIPFLAKLCIAHIAPKKVVLDQINGLALVATPKLKTFRKFSGMPNTDPIKHHLQHIPTARFGAITG